MRLAFIVPRYGAKIVGGAEAQARDFAIEAARRGWAIEVWTTCVSSHYTWQNDLPAGESQDAGVSVHRFPVQGYKRDLKKVPIQQGQPEPYEWLMYAYHSPKLYAHVRDNAANFDAVIALPYAMPLINFAAWAAPEKVILWPCLHNEASAYLESVHLLMESVWGVMYNSLEERVLANEILSIKPKHQATLGEGLTFEPALNGEHAVEKTSLLYIGRFEEGKNLIPLYQYMQRYVNEGGDLQLTMIGRGPVLPPAHPAFNILGFVSEAEKAAHLASSLALCLPSLNESFSRVIMESWLSYRPVLVHEFCDVTRGHVQRSKGGLWFSNYDEFVAAVTMLQQNPDRTAQMGRNGQEYVQQNYTWETIVDRFERILTAWQT